MEYFDGYGDDENEEYEEDEEEDRSLVLLIRFVEISSDFFIKV